MRSGHNEIIVTLGICVQVDNILREREESVERQRRLAAKTARLRRSLR